jgi:hypothetical protein
MKLIFLDIDGVLNRHDWNPLAMSNTIDRERMERLNRIIIETDALIVITSAWRYHYYRGEMSFVGLDWLLRTHGLAAGTEERPRVLGITRQDTMIEGKPKENERGQQIADFLNALMFRGPYVVIDDMELGIPEAGHPFVKIDDAVGITDADADLAIGLLNARP